ncbi:hypothetical protein, partial [Wohlfahrtiimonas larvae]
MKKTVLAVALPLIIYGCSDNNSAPIAEKFTSFEKNYLAATNTVIQQSADFSMGTMTYTAKLDQADDKIILKDNFNYSENQNRVLIQYNFSSDANVDLAKYNVKDGVAKIVGTTNGNITVEIPQTGDKVVIDNILANAKYEGELNEKNKAFGYTAKVENNTVPVLVSDTKVAEFTLTDLNNNLAIHFNDDYSAVKSFKSNFDGKGLNLKLVGPLAEEIQATVDATKLMSTSEYIASPLKYAATATVATLDLEFKSGKDSGKAKLSNLEAKTSLQENNEMISANVAYNIGGINIVKNQSAALDFGSLFVSTDIKGIKNIKNWKDLIEKANALSTQDPSDIDEAEAVNFLKDIANIFTKDTRIESVIENKLTIGDAVKVEVAFQGSEALVSALQQGPEAITASFEGKSPVELIDTFITEFKFKGTITEDYMIAQYEKFLTLNGQDTSKAKDEVKGGVQMVMMLVAMQTAPLGVSPVKFEEGTLFIDIAFKDGKWNINGTTLTTAEIFA